MTEDRVAANVPDLLQGAADIENLGQRVLGISANLYETCAANADAVEGRSYGVGTGYRGGGVDAGQFGPVWFQNYKPGEQAGLDFMETLKWGVGLTGHRTRDVALAFEEADNEANGTAGSA